MKRYWFLGVLFLAFVSCSDKPLDVSDASLRLAVDSLWSNPQLSQTVLDTMQTERLSEADRHIYTITRAHVRLKLEHALPDEELLNAAAAYCLTKKLNRYAGEVFYIQGAYFNFVGKDATAMKLLKQAERLFEGEEVPDILRGMTYYKMGRISETEQLYEVARRYYEQAVPYLNREIGRAHV